MNVTGVWNMDGGSREFGKHRKHLEIRAKEERDGHSDFVSYKMFAAPPPPPFLLFKNPLDKDDNRSVIEIHIY